MADSGTPPQLQQPQIDALLRGVARSFYLTLRILPPALQPPIALAYLLARAADTIADTRLLSAEKRLHHLQALRSRLQGQGTDNDLQMVCRELGEQHDNPAERQLLQSLPQIVSLYDALPEDDRQRVAEVVTTLSRGMEFDLNYFPTEDSGEITALQDAGQLEQYTYLVAGCVGEFWTAISLAHTPALRHWDQAQQSQRGVRFGKALQLTNILRDVARDLRSGRCYLPQEQLTGAGLTPQSLLEIQNDAQARPLLHAWIDIALDHYRAGEDYTLGIPRRCLRLRLAALWPLLIGLKTLALLAAAPQWLHPEAPLKLSRRQVYRLLCLSLPCAFSNTLLRRWLDQLHRAVVIKIT